MSEGLATSASTGASTSASSPYASAGARGAALVLTGLSAFSIIGALTAVVERSLVSIYRDEVPAMSTRAAIVVVEHALELALILVVIRMLARPQPFTPLAAVVCGAVGVVGAIAAAAWTFLSFSATQAVSLWGAESLARYAEDGAYLGLLSHAMRTLVMLTALGYALWRWSRADC